MFYLLLLAVVAPVSGARPATDKPNFVMLFVDDMGFGDTGFNGNTSVSTPNIDRLAFDGKILTDWYAACPICTGSRASLLTGRQFPRTGLPPGIGPNENYGLPLNETTIAEHLKRKGYATAAVGKWHLGQRRVYLPGNRGFDSYLGIPYSNDMGVAKMSACEHGGATHFTEASWPRGAYEESGFLGNEKVTLDARDDRPRRGSEEEEEPVPNKNIAYYLPLVGHKGNETRVVEQPADLTHLAEKYSDFAVDFIKKNKDRPFFLYVPFTHIHTIFMAIDKKGPEKHVSGCRFRGKSRLGSLGDALMETDWVVGNIHKALQDAGVEENTLILFTGDNGPWMTQGLGAGALGTLKGKSAGYYNVGKGSTWEGGIRSASFAYWKGQIAAHSRSSEVISSMDVFPTFSSLAGLPLPNDRVIDGRDMTKVLLNGGRSQHDFLFFYGGCDISNNRPSAVRHGRWKAHFCTGPGLGGCKNCHHKRYKDVPLLFDIVQDPAEERPLNPEGDMPTNKEAAEAVDRILLALRTEMTTFSFNKAVPEPEEPREKVDGVVVCCGTNLPLCQCDAPGGGKPMLPDQPMGLLAIGTERYHDAYHADIPPPASFLAQRRSVHGPAHRH